MFWVAIQSEMLISPPVAVCELYASNHATNAIAIS
jgi:hypothetical protein